MKKVILFIAISGFVLQAQAQKIMAKEVPSTVTMAFNDSHPSIKMVEWKKEGVNFEAGFEANKTRTCVVYDASGQLIETKVKMNESSLPKVAIDYVKKNYKNDMIKESFKITENNGTVKYGVKVKDLKLIFDNNGTYIKAVQCKE